MKSFAFVDRFHSQTDLTLAIVAAHLHVSEATARRALASQDLSYGQLVRALRLSNAVEFGLLSDTTLPVIAGLAGFGSPARVAEVFRREFGATAKTVLGCIRERPHLQALVAFPPLVRGTAENARRRQDALANLVWAVRSQLNVSNVS